MQDVARAAGVHQTTVSLALRNDTRLPVATRTRIQALAKKIGYRPDPMLSALNFYRSARRVPKSPATMAFLLNFRDRRGLAFSEPHRLFLEGARQHAEEIGYHLDVFYVGTNPAAPGKRLQKILRSRGITGIIVGAFADRGMEFQLNWSQFSAVQIESQQLGLSLHMISNDQAMITRTAIRRLRALGYRRIGLVVGEREEVYLRNAFTAGYYVEIAQYADLIRIPPCVLSGFSREEVAPPVAAWVRAHNVDVVMSNWHDMPEALRSVGVGVPRDVVVASLDLAAAEGVNAGMRQNHRIVGERAVEQLAILMKTNQRGLVESPNHTLIEGEWNDGSDVPRRKRARAKASPIRRRATPAIHL
jgi:DNA-binding LacI/PurR family transcriptional regulator